MSQLSRFASETFTDKYLIGFLQIAFRKIYGFIFEKIFVFLETEEFIEVFLTFY